MRKRGTTKIISINKEENIKSFIENCCEALRKTGARITQPRISVIQTLASTAKPLDAKEIYNSIQKNQKVKDVDQVSIYRILMTLKSLNLVHQIFPSGGYLPCFHSECLSAPHILLRCFKCESTDEYHVPGEIFDPFLNFIKKQLKFSLIEHAMQFDGVCKDCEQTKKFQK